eukprot:s3760_g2.t1
MRQWEMINVVLKSIYGSLQGILAAISLGNLEITSREKPLCAVTAQLAVSQRRPAPTKCLMRGLGASSLPISM